MTFQSPTPIAPGQNPLHSFFGNPPSIEADADHLEEQAIVGHNVRDVRSRPFSLLRSQVLRTMRERGWRSLGVTSASPAAGKSFLTANLAASLAQMHDVSVLVIDLDLRRASLARKLGIEVEAGVETVLEGKVPDLASIAVKVDPLDFTFLPARAIRGDSGDLLSGDRFGTMMDFLRNLPEDIIILCDLPPAFANDDAILILQHLDAYLFVVDEGTTTRTEMTDAISLLGNAPCIGTVLNRFTSTGDAGYGVGGRYDQYYGD